MSEAEVTYELTQFISEQVHECNRRANNDNRSATPAEIESLTAELTRLYKKGQTFLLTVDAAEHRVSKMYFEHRYPHINGEKICLVLIRNEGSMVIPVYLQHLTLTRRLIASYKGEELIA